MKFKLNMENNYALRKSNRFKSFGEVLYAKHKNKNFEVTVKIINSETSIEKIRREIN